MGLTFTRYCSPSNSCVEPSRISLSESNESILASASSGSRLPHAGRSFSESVMIASLSQSAFCDCMINEPPTKLESGCKAEREYGHHRQVGPHHSHSRGFGNCGAGDGLAVHHAAIVLKR